jgi:hypothetical protein
VLAPTFHRSTCQPVFFGGYQNKNKLPRVSFPLALPWRPSQRPASAAAAEKWDPQAHLPAWGGHFIGQGSGGSPRMEGSGGLIILQALSRHCFRSDPPQAGLF